MYLLWNCPQTNVTGLVRGQHWPLGQVMAWCHKPLLNQVDPDLCRHMASLGHNEITWKQIQTSFSFSSIHRVLFDIWNLRMVKISPLPRNLSRKS